MENTGNVLFPDDCPQWYIVQGEQWAGPLTAADVYKKVLDQEIGWADFVWKPGQSGWQRICDVKTFQAAVPQIPGKSVQKEIKEAVKEAVKEAAQPVVKKVDKKGGAPNIPAYPKNSGKASLPSEQKLWFLFFNDTQFGPFAKTEVARFLHTGKITPRFFAWKEGMGNWARIESIEDFDDIVEMMKKTAPKTYRKDRPPFDHRHAPRRPLLAQVLMAHDKSVATAVCRDISVGGMQALTDKIPGPVGTRVKMNVTATDETGVLEPFVAEGVIVRILEDGRGFSFRFDGLSDSARRAIEKYINSSS